jgi:hypothetical protein
MMDDTSGGVNRAREPVKPAKRAIICQLNDRWRVVTDGRPAPYTTWVLEYDANKHGDYSGQSFCQSREALKVAISEKVGRIENGAVDLAAREAIKALPDRAY